MDQISSQITAILDAKVQECKLPLPEQYGAFATDPVSGLEIPKTLHENLAWRKSLLSAAKSSLSMRKTLRAASASSPIFWLNAFGWTYLQKKIDERGIEKAIIKGNTVDGVDSSAHVPFITWKVQDDALVTLQDAIENGHDALISKARDMGASWLCLALLHWYWQFRPDTTFLELSRKEALVDKPGDMDSLFEKHRYLLKWQPEWLRPQRVKDNRLHLENGDIGTVIVGESTNKDAGQASRKTAILLDEFARVEKGDEIDLSTADTTACRIFNSTPGGPNTHFTRVYRGMKVGARKGVIVELPWWRHPDKGRNAEYKHNVERGECRWTSPWYADQVSRRSSRNVAQNLDMEHGKVGDMIFDPEQVEAHRRKFEKTPYDSGAVLWDDEISEATKEKVVRGFKPTAFRWVSGGSKQNWRLWIHLREWTDPTTGEKMMRPPQDTIYVIGVDISNGSGSSNSVISVLDHKTNRIVAKFWDSYTTPEELAEQAMFAAIWFGGLRPATIVFEKNGPGSIFGRKLLKFSYPMIYMQKNEGIKGDPKTPRWGWHSSPARKEMLLGEYREALKNDEIINHCKESLDEALEYSYNDKGQIEPGVKSEEGGGTALHGDHVIADALLVLGRKELPKAFKDEPTHTPKGSFADRKRIAAKRRQTEREAWSE